MKEILYRLLNDYGIDIFNVYCITLGLFANFFSYLEIRTQLLLFILASLVFNALFVNALGLEMLAISLILTFFWGTIVYFSTKNKGYVKRGSLDKLIRKFTETASSNDEICIFGGDVNFFGGVLEQKNKKSLEIALYNLIVLLPFDYAPFLPGNNIINYNRQFLQIKRKGFKKIYILCLKPEIGTERDKAMRLRLGFLANELDESLEIRFFDTLPLCNCKHRNELTPTNTNEKDSKLVCEHKVTCVFKNGYFPDLRLRGRIITQKSTSTKSVAIVSTFKSGKKYSIQEYSTNQNECEVYATIWNAWWSNCNDEPKLIEECKNEYLNILGIKTNQEENK